jgi:hypothetical protein
MANTDGAFGLRPVKGKGGEFQQNLYGIVPGSTALYVGDPVKLDSTGTSAGLQTVDIAGDTGALVGAITAIFDDTGFPAKYYPGGSETGYTCLVADNPMQEFVVQEDSGGAALTQADIGLNTNLLAGSGSTMTGRSGWELDSSDKNTTATLQVRILRLYDSPDNAIGDNAKWVVRINNHQNSAGTGAAGV